MSYKSHANNVLVLGAGELGTAVLQELARSRERTHLSSVSVLLRPARERAAMGSLDLEVVEADLATATVDDLAAIFSRFGRIICCTGFVGGAGTQRKITAAVLRAGVDHYIPWQFGVNYDVIGRGSGQSVWDEQLDVRDMLRAQDKVRWTIVSTGMFTSFVFLPAFGLVDLVGNRVHALGNWDYRLTVTTPEDIGRVTARIVTSRPRPDDTIVFVAGDTFSYRELADTVDHVLGRKVQRILRSLPELQADAAAHPDDTMRKYRLAFARPDGVAWPKDRTFNAAQGMAMVDVATWLRANRPRIAG
ncbi:aromatic alcohol reductase [Pendulispora albinea]|uniref:Aromatic alcohol reductase n=1 Tax=Pendulispora albinea TaxID=2741071 RepID=A0ABZ2M0I0_9BACT